MTQSLLSELPSPCMSLSPTSDPRKTGNINVGFVLILSFYFLGLACWNYSKKNVIKKLSILHFKYEIFFDLFAPEKEAGGVILFY